jgi:hypothetical protein
MRMAYAALVAIAGTCTSASAHHSRAAFDTTVEVTIQGGVVDML